MADCAILAIASTTPTVFTFLQRLVKDVVPDEHASAVPWTIANKYYTADVNFLVHSLASWTPVQREVLPPALLFIWNRGEPYRDQIRHLSQHAPLHEFEVALAIRLSPTGSILPAEIEDDQDIDAYLSSNGFEFVDVPDIEPSLPDRTGILGIPRIIDALSTIMWPSMIRRGFASAVQSNPGTSSDDYHSLARLVGEKLAGHEGDRMQQDLEELERWLDEDDIDARSTISEHDAVPWSTVVTPGTLSPSSSGFLENSRPTTPRAGFDDDFSAFISASSTSSTSIFGVSSEMESSFPHLTSTNFGSTFSFDSPSSGHPTPTLDDHPSCDITRLLPGGSYKSLGSVSDFGDPDRMSVNLEPLSYGSDVESEDMPSRVEIEETSRKIFGTMPPVQERGDGGFQAPNALGSQNCPGEEHDVEMADANPEHFDLQGVLGALQGLKEEIAGMPDKERRKAAARVALGLAYGLSPHSEASEKLI